MRTLYFIRIARAPIVHTGSNICNHSLSCFSGWFTKSCRGRDKLHFVQNELAR